MEEKRVYNNNTSMPVSNSLNPNYLILATNQSSESILKTVQTNLPTANQENYESDLLDPTLTNVDINKVYGYNPYMKEILTRVTCVICSMIPYDPLECKNCNAIICKLCMVKWNKTECILHCEGKTHDTPCRVVRDIINGIAIKCKNSHKGCLEELKINTFRLHESECDFNEVQCPCSGCKYTSLKRLILDHIDKCEFNTIQCKHCNN